MLRTDLLRARLLSLVSTGALAAATSTCSGHTDIIDTAATAGSAGQDSGKGGSGQGGSGHGGSGQGGAHHSGTGQGGVIQGGNSGVGGTIVIGGYGGGIIQPPCPPTYEQCYLPEEAPTCPVGEGGAAGSNEPGTECPAAECVVPPPIFLGAGPTAVGPIPNRDSCCYTIY